MNTEVDDIDKVIIKDNAIYQLQGSGLSSLFYTEEQNRITHF